MKGYGFSLCMFLAVTCGYEAHGTDIIIGLNEVRNDDIYITENTTIENSGILRGNIIFNGAYDLIIKNHNIIESNFTSTTGATITQVVSNDNDIHQIDNLENYTLKIQNADMLNMADIMAIATTAAEIRMYDSTVLVGTSISNIGIPIYLDYDDTLVIDGTNLSESCTLLSHIYGVPSMMTTGIDSMYVATPYMDGGGSLKITLQRQTNYSLVFDEALGGYLDGLRANDSNDKLIKHLDSANTRGALNRVLSKSARLNPVLLARPMTIFNTLHDTRIFNDTDSMATIIPFYVSSDEFNTYGGALNISGKLNDNVFAKIGLFGGTINYDGKVDDYKSALYGGNFDIAYTTSDYYIGTFGTISYAKFKDISIFDDGKITKNPSGFSGRFGFDVGPLYQVSNEIKLAPFVGGTLNYAKVLNDKDTNFNARGGIEMTVDTLQDGNKYNVGVRAFVQSDGGIYAMLHSNMLSVADGVGGGINVGILYSDSVVSYKIMGDINFLF